MKKNICYQQNQNKFKQLSDSLTILVNDLKSYRENITKTIKDKIILDINNMSQLCNFLDGVIEKDFITLKNSIILFLDDPKDVDDVMKKCVQLKNQLWEL